jgi:hypothetical protein
VQKLELITSIYDGVINDCAWYEAIDSTAAYCDTQGTLLKI